MHTCANCHQEVKDEALYCQNCGAIQHPVGSPEGEPLRPQEHAVDIGRVQTYPESFPSPLKKNPWLAGILNFFLPGIGYVYNGLGKEMNQIVFGVIVFLSVFVGVYVPLFGAPASASSTTATPQITVFNLLTLLILILPIGLAYDAYARASKMNASSST